MSVFCDVRRFQHVINKKRSDLIKDLQSNYLKRHGQELYADINLKIHQLINKSMEDKIYIFPINSNLHAALEELREKYPNLYEDLIKEFFDRSIILTHSQEDNSYTISLMESENRVHFDENGEDFYENLIELGKTQWDIIKALELANFVAQRSAEMAKDYQYIGVYIFDKLLVSINKGESYIRSDQFRLDKEDRQKKVANNFEQWNKCLDNPDGNYGYHSNGEATRHVKFDPIFVEFLQTLEKHKIYCHNQFREKYKISNDYLFSFSETKLRGSH